MRHKYTLTRSSIRKLDAVAILAGSAVRTPNGWRTTTYSEGDRYAILGCSMRPMAASLAWKINPKLNIYVLGGRGGQRDVLDAPVISLVQKKELELMDVPTRNIRVRSRAANTLECLNLLISVCRKSKIHKLGIISNLWHLPRLRVFLKHTQSLREGLAQVEVSLIAAEDVVVQYDIKPDWRQNIQKAYRSRKMKKRLALEKKGVRDFLGKTYGSGYVMTAKKRRKK